MKDIHSAAKSKQAKVLDVPLSESDTDECDRCKEWGGTQAAHQTEMHDYSPKRKDEISYISS